MLEAEALREGVADAGKRVARRVHAYESRRQHRQGSLEEVSRAVQDLQLRQRGHDRRREAPEAVARDVQGVEARVHAPEAPRQPQLRQAPPRQIQRVARVVADVAEELAPPGVVVRRQRRRCVRGRGARASRLILPAEAPRDRRVLVGAPGRRDRRLLLDDVGGPRGGGLDGREEDRARGHLGRGPAEGRGRRGVRAQDLRHLRVRPSVARHS
mmetsp:Transcript_18501/g.55003  ORF Transcript_18501/g.55003 Transcript_18501/m.55003 type:complete len:213 (-) Transcript_18501:56-694(-)